MFLNIEDHLADSTGRVNARFQARPRNSNSRISEGPSGPRMRVTHAGCRGADDL